MTTTAEAGRSSKRVFLLCVFVNLPNVYFFLRLSSGSYDINLGGISSSSRPGSSLDSRPSSRDGGSGGGESLFRIDFLSQCTNQTSLSLDTIHPMTSIYELQDRDQLEYNEGFSLGSGHFGIVYRGAMNPGPGEDNWIQVWNEEAAATL